METTDATRQLPLWVVQGTNWICHVPLDEHNAQFASIRQAEESATRAIEQFQGQERGLTLQVENGETVPELGGVTLVYPMGSDSNDGFLIFVHELLANAGFYKASCIVEKMTQEVLAKNEQGHREAMEAQEAQKPKKPRKPRKTTKKPKPKKPRKKP